MIVLKARTIQAGKTQNLGLAQEKIVLSPPLGATFVLRAPHRGTSLGPFVCGANIVHMKQGEEGKKSDLATPKWVISPTHKRTERRAPVWGSEFTTKAAAQQGRFRRTRSYAERKIVRSGGDW
jgi:hypothetical protein